MRKTALKFFVSASMATLPLLAGAVAQGPISASDIRVDVGGESTVSKSIVIPLGKSAIVDLPIAAADVLVSSPAVLGSVIRTPRRVYLIGNVPGQTNVFFFDSRNNLIANLEVRVEPDVGAVSELISRVMPDTRVRVETLHGNVILHGQVDTPEQAQRAEDLAARLVDGPRVVSMLSVRQPAQVLLKVRVVEMQRRLIRQLGIDMGGVAQLDDTTLQFVVSNSFALSGQSLGGLSGLVETPGFGDLTDLDFAFDVFEQNGLVRTLAEPTLVAMSGTTADFLAGGEFPVPEASEDGTPSVSFKEFGVSLSFRPQVYSKGRIQLSLETEVSETDFATGITIGEQSTVDDDGNTVRTAGYVVPGTAARNASTTVELPSGGSIAIAGLLEESITAFVDGVPGLKETPILGNLFRSQEFQSNQSELVIIATPYLVEPTSEAALTDPSQGYVPPTFVEQVLLGKLEAAYGVQQAGVGEQALQGPLGFIVE